MPPLTATRSTLAVSKMRPFNLIFAVFLLHFNLSAQTRSNCACGALIDPSFGGSISLYNRPNGRLVRAFRNDLQKEDFLILAIQKDSANFFHVLISNAQSEAKEQVGWIKKSNRIGTYARNYSPGDTLFLYTKPSESSNVRTYIPNWLNGVYTIVSCKGSWAYVRIKYKGEVKSGWLSPDRQCDNPYTTCN